MEGWRKVGDPASFAKLYAENGADELLFMDVVASLYGRNNLQEIVEKVASQVFIPMTVGGGIRSVEDVSTLLACGADKVALNTAATRNPTLITAIADLFGAQATVVSIEAIRSESGQWQVMTDNGRNHTGRDVLQWACEAEDRGAGEIVLTTIHTEGLGHGYDLEMIEKIADMVNIPVVACGGLGTTKHLSDLIQKTKVSAAAIAQALHWEKLELSDLRSTLADEGCFIRPC
jgi:cyclase